jgi:hypothetical protein
LSHVPRYYLHIRSGDELIVDEEGSDLPDLEAAREETLLGARDMLVENFRAGEALDGDVVEITDEGGNLLDTVPVRYALHLAKDQLDG